jgi:hypothetical protein
MTLDQIINAGKEMLTAADVAGVIGCDPYNIVLQARQDVSTHCNSLGFPVIVIGKRVKIPRRAFLEFIGVRGLE